MSQIHTTKIAKARQIKFLRSVFWLGLTAFGGPQMHIPQFKRRLVDKHRFFTVDTLTEVNAFCSLLPGSSTTQTITIYRVPVIRLTHNRRTDYLDERHHIEQFVFMAAAKLLGREPWDNDHDH